MRIVAGEWRGRVIEAPQDANTRPTVDRVREALFSSLYSLRGGFEGAMVLDAFAGSGALGLEALSRGAARAIFYERDAKAAAVCKRNIAKLGADATRAACVQRDVLQAPPTSQQPPFDLVLLDPPYAYDPHDVIALVRTLADAGALCDDVIIVYEHAHNAARETSAAAAAAGFPVTASKKYGKTGVTIMQLES